MEEETNLAETPEVESVPVADEPEVELDESGNPIEGTDNEPEPEFAEVEYDGKQYKLPPELKDALLRQQDYTRKTQEVAEIRKQAEATLQAVSAVTQEERQAQVQLGIIDAQIADYNSIDWDTWEQTDPQSANRAWRQFQQLQMQRQGAVQSYTQAQQQRAFLEQQETAKRLEQGAAEVRAKIPDWSPDKARALVDFGQQAYGLTQAELSAIDDPRMIIALHDAYQFRQQQKTRQAAAKVQDNIKPTAKVVGGKPAVKPLDDRAGTDAWMKARQAQLSKR